MGHPEGHQDHWARYTKASSAVKEEKESAMGSCSISVRKEWRRSRMNVSIAPFRGKVGSVELCRGKDLWRGAAVGQLARAAVGAIGGVARRLAAKWCSDPIPRLMPSELRAARQSTVNAASRNAWSWFGGLNAAGQSYFNSQGVFGPRWASTLALRLQQARRDS